MTEIDWKARCEALESDRDWWKSRAQGLQERITIMQTETAPVVDGMPEQLNVAIDREMMGAPADIIRQVKRVVYATYADTNGDEPQKIHAALKRLQEGDAGKVEQFLGEEE